MLKSLGGELNKAVVKLNIFEKLQEFKTLKGTNRVLEELAGKGAAKVLYIKRGIVTIKCKNPTTAHYLRTYSNRIQVIANADSVKFVS